MQPCTCGQAKPKKNSPRRRIIKQWEDDLHGKDHITSEIALDEREAMGASLIVDPRNELSESGVGMIAHHWVLLNISD